MNITPPPLDDSDVRDEQLALLLDELSSRVQRGESADVERICAEYPDLADELRQLWGAVLVAEVAGYDSRSSSDQAHNSEASLRLSTLPPLPFSIGDYELQQEIGHGGMGVVFRAHQTNLRRDVALKMILPGKGSGAADIARFRAEAEAVAKLNHPGIVPVYEVGEWEGRPFFSMKYIPGQTLSQKLAAGPLPAREAARLLLEVCRAIQHAHEEGVLHRDLKPSNILLDLDGQPHLSDFGLAKQIEATASLTRTGAILGTPSYMAPEQAAGARGQVGPSTDIYSLGSILYHMLTGRPPFQAASPVDTVLLLLEQDPVPPHVINPKCDNELELIALRCLQKPPDLRYPTAATMAADLEAFLNDEPISANTGRFSQILSRLFRETHHAPVLENWGTLWMWHGIVLLIVNLLTELMFALDYSNRWSYASLWTIALWMWAYVFWVLRQRVGPVTFVERQIAHLWAGSMIAIALLFPLEYSLELAPLALSPVLPLDMGLVFLAKAAMLSGAFYLQAGVLFGTAMLMARWPNAAHVLFGIVSALCFFVPGWQYHQRRKANRQLGASHML
ncbi:MAG: serine/threonine-protein kinase [Planctomycetota bacterium]